MKSHPKHLSVYELQDWLHSERERPVLIDVREMQELGIAPFPFDVVHMPLSKFEALHKTCSESLPSNQSVVVICHAGIRSWQFAQWLAEEHFFGEIWSLDGGIDAWSVNIDSNVPRY